MIGEIRIGEIRLKRALAAFFVVSFAVLNASANDTSLGGKGAVPYPIQNDQVAMVEETVDIKLRGLQGVVDTNVTFVFENQSKEPVEFLIGFPFEIYFGSKSDEDNWVRSHSPTNEYGRPNVQDFKAWVDDKPIQVELIDIDPTPLPLTLQEDKAFAWRIRFEPGQRRVVKNQFSVLPKSVSSGGEYIEYLLRTGRLWRGGKIGRSKIDVRVSNAYMTCQPKDARYAHESIFFPETGSNGQVTPDGWSFERTTEGMHWSWDLREFKPTEDLQVCVEDRGRIAKKLDRAISSAPPAKTALEAEARRYAVDAAMGVPVPDDLLRVYDAYWWYQPVPGMTEATVPSQIHERREVTSAVAMARSDIALSQEKAHDLSQKPASDNEAQVDVDESAASDCNGCDNRPFNLVWITIPFGFAVRRRVKSMHA